MSIYRESNKIFHSNINSIILQYIVSHFLARLTLSSDQLGKTGETFLVNNISYDPLYTNYLLKGSGILEVWVTGPVVDNP